MPWYELTSDVMVRGTPRSFGEVLDLTEAEGQLLSGLGRAKPAQPPAPPEPVCPLPTPEAVKQEAPAEEPPAPAPKPAARRRAPVPPTQD